MGVPGAGCVSHAYAAVARRRRRLLASVVAGPLFDRGEFPLTSQVRERLLGTEID